MTMSGISTGINLQDNFTNVMFGIINSVNLALSSIQDLQGTMAADVDTSSLQGARDEINQVAAAMTELNSRLLAVSSPAVGQTPAAVPESPIHWQSDGLEVFDSLGIERFQHEIQSANNMMNTLNQTQMHIQQTAGNLDLLPDGAVQDINSLGLRLQTVQQRIQRISDNPANAIDENACAEMEQLRVQLDGLIQQQNCLNAAMESADISDINAAYINLSRNISNTERYIRDNTDEQGRFNNSIRDGTQQADNLMRTIKSAVAAYLSIQTVKKVLDISDNIVLTTSRLNIMNDGLQTTDELVKMVYASAQDARGSFDSMARLVARFGNNAKDAFGSSQEVVAFTNLVQKQMTIAGATTQEAANAMLQLSQALGSGVLRGDELNSIFEQAPNLIQSIADYLNVPIGQIREMAQEGQLSANVVKAAVFASADDINAKFNEMPMTWGQTWQLMKNTALMNFQPVLKRINDLANSQGFQKFVNSAIRLMSKLAKVVLNIFDLVASVGGFIADNWSLIGPVIMGVVAAMILYTAAITANNIVTGISNMLKTLAAVYAVAHGAAITNEMIATTGLTAAQLSLNAALLSSPITWIIVGLIAIIAVIYLTVAAINKVTGKSISATGVIAGAILTFVSFFINKIIMMYNYIATLAEFFLNVWNNPIYSTKKLFVNLASVILDFCISATEGFDDVATNLANAFITGANLAVKGVNWIISALNKIPGVDLDKVGKIDEVVSITSSLRGTKDRLNDWLGEQPDDYIEIQRQEYINLGDAWNAGYNWGEGIEDSISNLFSVSEMGKGMEDYLSQANASLDNILSDTGDISGSLDITDEELKYLRDIAEQETVNRFTTADITINQTNNNNVSSGLDLDGVVSGIIDAVNEAVEIVAEGVHI